MGTSEHLTLGITFYSHFNSMNYLPHSMVSPPSARQGDKLSKMTSRESWTQRLCKLRRSSCGGRFEHASPLLFLKIPMTQEVHLPPSTQTPSGRREACLGAAKLTTTSIWFREVESSSLVTEHLHGDMKIKNLNIASVAPDIPFLRYYLVLSSPLRRWPQIEKST